MIHKMISDQFGDIALDGGESAIQIVDFLPSRFPEDVVRELFAPCGIRLLRLVCKVQDCKEGRICLWQFAGCV